MSGMRVRRAVVGDAAEIARVHIASWREAYAHALPAEALDALDEADRAERWAAILQGDGSGARESSVFVAEVGGHIVGWSSSSRGRDADAPAALELQGLYVFASEYGTGAGQRLLDAAIGDRAAYLWMLDDNPRADAFYRRNRFERDGVSADRRMIGHPVRIARMVRTGHDQR